VAVNATVGFLQVYHANCDDFWVRFGVPQETFGLDLAIGAPAARNRGVGRAALLLTIERLFQWPEVKRVQIDPDPENAHAVRTFAAAGFEARGVYPGYDGDEMLYMAVER
jgi:RimJ/RimL family protein N-acetyltransferase